MGKLEECMKKVKIAREALEKRLTLILECEKEKEFNIKYKKLMLDEENRHNI